MGIINSAFGIKKLFSALALACLLSACVHLPKHVKSRDALGPQEHLQLGSSYESQGLHKEAASQYEAAVRSDPTNADGWLALGNLAFNDGRLKDAETSFRRALKVSPNHPGAGNNLAMVILARNGNLPEAEALAQDALHQGGPLRPYILDTLANIYLRQKRYAEALAAIKEAEAAMPPDNSLMRDQITATRDSIQARR